MTQRTASTSRAASATSATTSLPSSPAMRVRSNDFRRIAQRSGTRMRSASEAARWTLGQIPAPTVSRWPPARPLRSGLLDARLSAPVVEQIANTFDCDVLRHASANRQANEVRRDRSGRALDGVGYIACDVENSSRINVFGEHEYVGQRIDPFIH